MSLNFSNKILPTLGLCVWMVVGFFTAQTLVMSVWQALVASGTVAVASAEDTFVRLIILAGGFAAAIMMIVGVPKLMGIDLEKHLLVQLGMQKGPRWLMALLVPAGFLVYMWLSLFFSNSIAMVWPGFNVNQSQEVGFSGLTDMWQYVAAFIALVIIPPLVEEALFRGYLFGMLRKYNGFVVSTVLTSAIFGIVHSQVNVGIDVFALSLVLCYLREKTGSIWAGVGLHMLKNLIAFVLLFVYPDLLRLIPGL